MKRYVINGKFLTQKMTGVQRFSKEIIKALDKIVSSGEMLIAIPQNAEIDIDLKNIEVKRVGKARGVLWEQISFPIFLIKYGYEGINLGNIAPVLKPDYICIHDILVFKYPQWFSKKFVIWYKFIYFFLLGRAKGLFTVSEFSKNEIKSYFKIEKEISVLSEGWQHIDDKSIGKKDVVLRKFGLHEKNYFFSNCQLLPYKNYEWIIEMAKRNPQKQFVVTGWRNDKVSKMLKSELENLTNIKRLGYIPDDELRILVKSCRYFIFPSFYEGFGLPPLEALSLGAEVIVSDIPVLREVFQDAVQYVDPYDYNIDLDNLAGCSIEDRNKVLREYSWDKGARKLYHILMGTYLGKGEKAYL